MILKKDSKKKAAEKTLPSFQRNLEFFWENDIIVCKRS